MFYQMLLAVISAFRSTKAEVKSVLDAAFTEHAAAVEAANRDCQVAISEADRKLWETIWGKFDQVEAAANDVDAKAAEFQRFADTAHAEANRVAGEARDLAARLDPPPAPPAVDAQIEVEETTTTP